MKWLAALVLVLAAFFTSANPVLASGHCIDADSHVEYIVDSMPMGEIAETITGDELKIFLAAFNATPPVTEYRGDRLVIIASEIMPSRVYGALMAGDCAVFGGIMQIETLRKYKLGIPITPIGWAI